MSVTSYLSTWKCWYFSWQNVFGPPQKLWLWTEKPEGTSSAIFGLGTAEKLRTQALCRPSSQQNQQQRWSPRRQIRNLNFSPSTKKTAEYFLELFLSISFHLILVTLWCRRTDGRSREYYVTTKISWLDKLPNLLSNGAPSADSAISRQQGVLSSV